ncbi:MAG: dihydrodipicolinate synthase family protein [Alphaproteobacteria bacterium]|nr:dihydrodipicolinate synthase family protein [Alphaproteobacteria bacterium]
MSNTIRGVHAAVLSPLAADGTVDAAMLAAHCRWLLTSGCDGVTLFGTTGEGPSFSVAERKRVLKAVLTAGVPSAQVSVGTGCAAIADTIELTHHAAGLGCAGALVLPPFFFKDIGDDGVHASFAALFATLESARIPIYLYNIPSVSAVSFSLDAIERLVREFPDRVAGIKDSTADWSYTEPLLSRFARRISVLVGAEHHLAAALKAGGAGTICGVANIAPGLLRRVHSGAADAHADVEIVVKQILSHSFVPAMKAIRARQTGDRRWLAVRPPLVPIDHTVADRLHRDIERRISPAEAAQ